MFFPSPKRGSSDSRPHHLLLSHGESKIGRLPSKRRAALTLLPTERHPVAGCGLAAPLLTCCGIVSDAP